MSLDSIPKQSFEDIARLAAELCQTAHAVICLLKTDQLHMHACYSRATDSLQLHDTVCAADAIVVEATLVVPDLQQDPQLHGRLLATGAVQARFYAAVPLRSEQGTVLGSLAVLDPEPRPGGLTPAQQTCLAGLARQVVTLLEIRQASEEHRTQQILQSRILDSATDCAIIAMDPSGRVTRWNTGAERILGWREDEMLGDPARAFFTPEDRAAGRPEAEMALALRDGNAPDERWHLRKGGERFWASGELMPLKDETGTVRGFLKILRDRTQQREDAAGRNASELRFRSLVELSPQMVWFGDAAGNITYCSPTWYDYTGLTPGDTSGDGWASVVHPDHRERVRAVWMHALATEGSYEVEIPLRRASDGQYRWYLARGKPVRNAAGVLESWIGIAIDIHERKAAEQRFRALTELSPAIIWFGNPDGSLSYLNDRWYEYTGQTPAQALPLGWSSVIHPDDLPGLLKVWEDARSREVLYDTEARLRRYDGVYRWFLIRAEPLRDEAGKVVGWLGSNSDITEPKRAEEHQRLLTGELQHRVKNTLALVQAIASQTLRGANDINEAREALTARLVSLGRAHDILTRTSWTAAPIAEVIESALCVHRQSRVPRIRIGGPNVPLAAKPALSLALAVHELATNAVKYGALSNEEGTVDLRWHVVHKSKVPRFRLTWSEQGGPPILSQPTRRGFGSRLIERTFAADAGGEVKLTYAPTGLVCRLEAPLASMQEQHAVAAA